MSSSKQYFLMFRALEGGVIEPREWSSTAFKDDESIIVMDEENLVIWVWHGKRQGLVSRRTANRQAQSLKGHGYKVGNSIVGRNLREMIEIDQRKIGREPETDKNYEKFEQVINMPVTKMGQYIVAKGTGGKAPESAPKPEAKPEASASTQQSAPEGGGQVIAPNLNKQKASSPAPQTAASAQSSGELSQKALEGLFVMATLNVFKDVFISKKSETNFRMETLDSLICEFELKNGELAFSPDSFNKVGEGKKAELLKEYRKLKSA